FVYAEADTTFGWPPLSVNFSGNCDFAANGWAWDFGDGETSTMQSPSHIYPEPGIYDVRLDVDTTGGIITRNRRNFIVVLADTTSAASVLTSSGTTCEVIVSGRNITPLEYIQIPVDYANSQSIRLIQYQSPTVAQR
ncbi:MAG: PKD domain-containing protein, partial [Candidatus Zixiibacteriota bacterium]